MKSIIPHTPEHKADWIYYGRPRKYPKGHIKNPFGNPMRFRCEISNCEVNHGAWDCPICKLKGEKRVMDTYEKEQGHCGDCGLALAFVR